MNIPNAYKDAILPALDLTWRREDGEYVDLTGATLTGRLYNKGTASAKDITGTLSITKPVQGRFNWNKSAGDVDTAGQYLVQFKATYSSGSEYSIPDAWEVLTPL